MAPGGPQGASHARQALRLGDSTVPAERLLAEQPDHVWALDFHSNRAADGRTLELLHVVDEFTTEALAIECRQRTDADHVRRANESQAALDSTISCGSRLAGYACPSLDDRAASNRSRNGRP